MGGRRVARIEVPSVPLDQSLCFVLSLFARRKTVSASSLHGRVRLWDVATGHLALDLDFHDTVMSLAFSADGKLLAVATLVANEVKLLELPSGKEFATLKAHVMGIPAVAFCPDGKTLATGGFDGKVKLWNLTTRQEVLTISPGARLPMLRFAPDGGVLAVGNLIRFYRQPHVLRAPSFSEIAEREATQPIAAKRTSTF